MIGTTTVETVVYFVNVTIPWAYEVPNILMKRSVKCPHIFLFMYIENFSATKLKLPVSSLVLSLSVSLTCFLRSWIKLILLQIKTPLPLLNPIKC